MNGITLFMAFVDAIPVVIFLFAAITLINDQKEEIDQKGIWNYTLLCSGSLMLFGGAILKVAWKTLYALNICDYTTLSESFFPMQTIGFAMMAMGVLGYISKDRKSAFTVKVIYGSIMFAVCTLLIIAFSKSASIKQPAAEKTVFVYESHMPFLLGTFIGFMTLQIALMILAVKRKVAVYSLAFLFSMIFMIAEAIAGSIFDGSSKMHWIAQIIHIFAEIGLFIGARGLLKKKHSENSAFE